MAGVIRSLTKKLNHHKREDDSTESSPTSTPSSSRPPIDRKSIADDRIPVGRKSLVEDRANGDPRKGSTYTTTDTSAGTTKDNKLKSAGHDLASKLRLGHHGKGTRESLDLSGRRLEVTKGQRRKQEKKVELEHKREEHMRLEAELRRKRQQEQESAQKEDTPAMLSRYGFIHPNSYAGEWHHIERINFLDLKDAHIGKEVFFRARIHTLRKMSAKLSFFVLRQQIATIQGVLQENERVSKHMVYWAEHLPVESIMLVRGVVQKPKAKEGEVIGASIHDKEILIHEFKAVSRLTEHLPFTVAEAETTEEDANAEGSTRQHVGDRARLQSRILDLRTTTSQAIFRIQSGVCNLFRSYLDGQGFMEIHTPKLQGGASESGASVFKVDYFGRTAFLAQSPQLPKQMSICADFGKVYEIGPVFRAENSNTHRHLTEFTGMDIEMAIDEHYWEARNVIDGVLKNIFKGIYERYGKELEMVKTQFPHNNLVWLDETPVIPFKDAITMLNATGWTDEDGKPLPLDEDLGTRDEIQLGRVIKEKYKTDYYIIDKFPASARPFYTMPDPVDPTYTNSFDIFVRGQEIVSGSQRVHDATMLIKQMEKVKVDPKNTAEYIQGFEWGAPPHAGAGIGMERLVMLLLQLGDIRHASMYPRDPKSLPATAKITQLRHPEASTLNPPWEEVGSSGDKELQPLEKLIANYGDASNTSWLEPRMKIWRDDETGAAVGYVPHHGFAITIGNPLCHISQYPYVIGTYLEHVKHKTDLKPLWLLCGGETADVLGDKLDWRTFTCAAEQRVNLTTLQAANDHEVQRKIRHAQKEGIKIHDIPMGTPPGRDFREKIDKRIEDWLHNRKNHQHVHLTDVHPWQDLQHRQFHYASDKNGTIHALVILAQLSPEHCWQVKFSLDFPDAPSGTIEATVVHALNAMKNTGATTCTFGGGASNNFTAQHNLKGAKVKMLSKAYHTIATELKLTQKSEFREKLGAEEDPIYICYPPRGMGPKGISAVLSFFED